ncbi:hypothetical protein [Virgibacillus doumboii]|uniref:hypothetical protein n=1 Tax=Virgibacillus doumboii TaxID=2697503 RepID=UPI0013DF821D|nr:hypothetical protein [Virgibacillus doumboii]
MQDFFYLRKNGKQKNKSDDLLIREIQDLISQFQNPNLTITTREEIFHTIIYLTNQLIE